VTNAAIGAVDIGGTKIAVAALSETGVVLRRLQQPTSPRDGFANAMRRTAEMLHELERLAGVSYRGIGVACPGPLDPLAGMVGDVGTLPGWQGGKIVAALSREFGILVALENDADAAALAEASWGAARGSSRFLYVTISTGIGAGIVLSGELYRGVDGAHPEVGHHVIDWSGPLCYCGAHGCWESLASGPSMAAWFREHNPKSGEPTAAQICDLAREGDELARRAVEREGFYIGLGLANLITIFTPDTIALGGGLMKSADLFMDRIRQVIGEVCTQVPADKTVLTLASLGADTGLAGAARAWIHRYARNRPVQA
jgi:glucokinase